MATNIASTSGRKLQIGNETSLGVLGSFDDAHFEPELDLPTKTRQTYVPTPGGRTNPADTPKAIDYEDGSGTGSVPLLVRRGKTTAESLVGRMLRGGGWLKSAADTLTTTAAGTVVGSVVLAADNNVEDGYCLAIEQDDGTYEPMQVAAWTVGTTTAIPVFDLATAPTDGNAVQRMDTYYPQTGRVPANATIQARELSRVEDGAGNPQQWTHSAVATKLQDLTITPNTPLKMVFDLMIGNTTLSDGTWSAETFNDREEIAMSDGSFVLQVLQGDPSLGGLTHTKVCAFDDITIAWGITVTKATCVGGDNVNSVGAYMVDFEAAPQITLKGVFDSSLWADYETTASGGSGTNPDTAIQLAWVGGSILHPTVLISFPRCNLIEAPEAQTSGTESKMVQSTLMYRANRARLNSNIGPNEIADQACFISISSQLS